MIDTKNMKIEKVFKALEKLNPATLAVKISDGEMHMTNDGSITVLASSGYHEVIIHKNQIGVKYADESNTGIIITPAGITLSDDTELQDTIERIANAVQVDHFRVVITFESVIVMYNAYDQTLQVDFGYC